ncbi:PhnO protein [Dyadobacter sp. BE34]|uniref:PhnO protein n=1 Tax=Dyadobacter fermentans TaxID=94254 RepID=A0ABU1R6K7_9BACT|nr:MULTISPECIES: GNAT family N-acetyltransferase [Dyadobacter]MDR6809039.1 PhnO protein [Dyadobacter fermentans]MDR7046782.1 PhnO protein [Dyadobacter sp. BE242]MDR7201096.1 PhnO protein [Dyadobacter sp. BE34]MDR7219056.1 PhnO protein [Dyadobacter sp. BE31]MDR7264734.1 PhnO protein [Dyadobacter sp. BE32]
MHAPITIRRASAADRELIYHMICSLENTILDRTGFDAAFDRNVANPNISYFLAELDGKPVGMVSCHIQPLLHHAALVSEIQEMYVEPEYRSQQVGKALMEHVTAFAKGEGAVQMEVTSRATREQAHRFYQREGFEKSHVKLVRYFNNE